MHDMAKNAPTYDRLDAILEELERARQEPAWVATAAPEPKRLLRAPDAVAQGRWQPSRPAIAAMFACALLAVAIFGVRLLLARDSVAAPVAAPAPKASSSVRVSAPATSLPGASTSPSPSASPTKAISMRIHVVGAVAHPGVVSVASGARVWDAVMAAGGMTKEADPTGVNLARALTDGEQVHVPKPGEKWTPPADAQTPAANPASPGSPATSGAKQADGSTSGTVNLNTADLAALDSLPGVGPVLAQRILEWRTEHGKFSTVDELGEVSGIGDKLLARLKPKVTV